MKNLASNVLTIGYRTYKAFEIEMQTPFLFFVQVFSVLNDPKTANKYSKY
jgi:hypothetical protein